MATIVMQRDLVVTLKKETILNVGLMSKLQPMVPELSRLIFKENGLEKPTQNLFNQLSYYLVSIIDDKVHASLTWPLYDTKAERAYRNEFSSFISDYSSKGLLTPVMSSYLVNPGCYKVTVLIFQLSQLAVNRMLLSKMEKDNKKAMYNTMTEKYKSNEKEGFVECIERETELMLSKFSNYLCKKQITEKIAELFRNKITEMEKKLSKVNGQAYINNLVDDFINKTEIDESSKHELLKIKDLKEESNFFENWLHKADEELNTIESNWNENISPYLSKCNTMLELTEELVHRHTGQIQRSLYTIEYDPKSDEICTKDLQQHVNSEQKYILRNLERDGKLYFPNLIRAFVISICLILKNNEIGDEIYKFNEYLESGKRNFGEVPSALKALIERILNAEAKLQSSPVVYNQSISIKEYPEISQLPDLSDLRTNRDRHQVLSYNTFTPLNISKHQFNLRRKISATFAKPQPKSLTAPLYQGPKDDFLKSLISCRISSYDRANMTQSSHNLSVISNINKVNETIAECSSGFTRQQILRLVSTKKSSSSKKFKHKQDRPDNINIKKGNLFNESVVSNESNGLYRSYSSPNLFENKERRLFSKAKSRNLSIMQEDSPPQLDVSGIACLDTDSNVLHSFGNAESSRKMDTTGLPPILVTNADGSSIVELEIQTSKNETPKANSTLIRKTSSLEKIINRFKKVRASVIPQKKDDSEIETIIEEKENKNIISEVYTANKVLLPDLLSPSCSTLTIQSNASTNYLDSLCFDLDDVSPKKPRESLGTALGVDQRFLDQFDLID